MTSNIKSFTGVQDFHSPQVYLGVLHGAAVDRAREEHDVPPHLNIGTFGRCVQGQFIEGGMFTFTDQEDYNIMGVELSSY